MKLTKIHKALALTGMLAAASYGGQAAASTLTGGDAADQASADAILDIVFTIDTSGSMVDDINAIASVAAEVVANLECADTDVWVRARFMGIAGNYGSFWNENVRSYLISEGRTPVTNNIEDNGVVVSDIINNADLFFTDDSTSEQDYYQAIVTIGDEGTDNGQPVNQTDIDVAYQANQDAINSNTLLFSWVVDDPYTNVPVLFEAMAEGGQPTIGAYTVPVFGDTGGAFVQQGSGDSIALASTLEEVICTAATGGGGEPTCPPTHSVPEPSSIALLGVGLSMLGFSLRRRQKTR